MDLSTYLLNILYVFVNGHWHAYRCAEATAAYENGGFLDRCGGDIDGGWAMSGRSKKLCEWNRFDASAPLHSQPAPDMHQRN
jgi:hypothetical protein